MTLNTTKTELRQYALAIIIAVDAMLSSVKRLYFDGVVN